jgi:DNA recombination protein RmuC
MEINTLLLGLIGGLAIGAVVAVAVARTVRQTAAADRAAATADRDAALEVARQAFAAERETSAQQTVDLVLSIAADTLGARATAADQQLDLRNQMIEEKVTGLSTGLTERLDRVTDLVAGLQKDRASQHGELTTRLTEATQQTRDLAETTYGLRQVLANPKTRGQWGERMADDVLRMAGLVEGVNYRRQTGVAGGGIPDVTFLLPQGRVLHMDVKFPIDNYVRAIEATSEADLKKATTAFLRDVRLRIKELTGRAYIDPETTVDYVLAFIPNESVYSFIHEHDADMIDFALTQRVVLCSPFTLFAVLAVIRQSMDAYRLERTSDEILICLGGFTKEWEKFSDQVDKLGRTFDSTQRAYDELSGTRRRALQRKLDQVEDLRTRRGDEADSTVIRSLRVAPRDDALFDADDGYDDRVPRSS